MKKFCVILAALALGSLNACSNLTPDSRDTATQSSAASGSAQQANSSDATRGPQPWGYKMRPFGE
jgi:hypothetical protein